jgi:hypothetical protein
MVENTKHVVRFLQKHIQKIGQNADLNRNKKIWKKVVLKKKCGSYIRIIDQQSTDQKSIFRKKRQRKGIFIMADKMIENNQVVIMGEIVSPFTFSHQVFGEGFYLVDVMVKRLSESQDIIPVMVSERLVDVSQDYLHQRSVPVLQPPRGEEEPSGTLRICAGIKLRGGRGRFRQIQPDLPRWIHM